MRAALVPRVRGAFDRVRDLGNKATDHHLSDEQRALDSVRSCFGLGVWFHRALSDDRTVRAFVPPEPPAEAALGVVDELRSELDRMRAELAEAQTRLSDATSREAAEARAREEAEEIVRRASEDRTEVLDIVRQLEERDEAHLAALAPPVDVDDSVSSQAAAPEPVKVAPAARERIVERAREPEPLNEIQARRLVDRMLAEAGWLIQDFGELNPLAGVGVAVQEFPLTRGRADYVLYVDGQVRDGGQILFPLDTRNGGGIMPLLTVHGDTAEGRFLPEFGGFMPVRQQRRYDLAQAALRAATDEQGDERTTPLTPEVATDDAEPFEFFSALFTGGYDYLTFTPSAGGPTETWIVHADGSWVCHTTDTGGTHRVRQGGPNRLWDRIEQLHQHWNDLGAPQRQRFGLTVTPDAHTVWLDDPSYGRTWALR